VPVWVGNYVLMSYGDGAVMGVPAHDERDFAFALKYGLPIRRWSHVDGEHYDYSTSLAGLVRRQAARRDHQLRQLQRPGHKAAVDAIAAAAAKGLGEKKTTWRLRDWGVSRQRYWGTPIPIIHCDDCGAVPVPEKTCRWCCPRTWCPTAAATR
jgi:leucyl-tRNA synthetase